MASEQGPSEIPDTTEPARAAILVVDDDERNRMAIAEVLADLDADIVSAASGHEALRCVLRQEFCAILLDVRMPGMDGYETAAIIRQREKSRRIPLIFLTAYDKEETQVFRGYSAGAVDYVFKPVEPVILRAKASVFVELQKQSDEIRRKAEQERRLLEENIRVRAERMEAEQQLRSTERREALIIRSLPIAVYEAAFRDGRQHRQFLHEASARRLLGFAAADISRNPRMWRARVHPDDRPALDAALAGRPSTEGNSLEYRWLGADGSYRNVLDQWVAAGTDDDGRRHVFGTILDVHERRSLERQLVHAQKIDAIGKLTGGIVHDFNNMLTVVIGNLDRIRRSEALDERNTRRVGNALQGALHCRDMTKRLLGFARQQSIAPDAIDLNALIQELAGLVSRTLGERIEIEKTLADELWQTFLDPGQTEAAILNLLVNARDAMPDGGRVAIRTANLSCEGPEAGVPLGLPPGEYVVLEVADTGVGMEPEVLAHAGEPFFTTKEAGRGTGLGLSTIDSLARQAGGAMTIDSAPGKGTTVRLILPRHRSEAVEQRTVPPPLEEAPLRTGNGERILVVEDDEEVRRTAAGTLVELGYRVLEAGTAADALSVLEQEDEIHLLFTDLVMPGPANGYELSQAVKTMRPDIRTLFTSAYGDAVISALGGESLHPMLAKPYRDHELATAVHNALALPPP